MAGEIHFISEMRREPRFAPPNYALHITQRLDSSSGTCRPFIATPHGLLRAGYRKNPPGSQPGRSETPTQTRFSPVGRNAPCPCGSPLKFKRCCGNPVPQARAA